MNPETPFNKIISCAKILEIVEPDYDRTKMVKYAHLILFSLLLYPVLNSICLALVLASAALWISIVILVCLFFIVLNPLMEIKNHKMPASSYLRRKEVPVWLVTILMIPLYPINLIWTIVKIGDIIDCDNCSTLGELFILQFFFIVLPCVMTVGDDNDDE